MKECTYDYCTYCNNDKEWVCCHNCEKKNFCNDKCDFYDRLKCEYLKKRRKIVIKSINFFFRWYDLWIGLYIDIKNKVLYFCPLPTIGIKIQFDAKDLRFKQI